MLPDILDVLLHADVQSIAETSELSLEVHFEVEIDVIL